MLELMKKNRVILRCKGVCVLSEHDLSSVLFDSSFAVKILGN